MILHIIESDQLFNGVVARDMLVNEIRNHLRGVKISSRLMNAHLPDLAQHLPRSTRRAVDYC
jgi:hypothetical protein